VVRPDHRLLMPNQWHLATPQSPSLYTSVSRDEWHLLTRDAHLRTRLEALLVKLGGAIEVESLLFVHAEGNHLRTVAALSRDGDGAMQWQWEAAEPVTRAG